MRDAWWGGDVRRDGLQNSAGRCWRRHSTNVVRNRSLLSRLFRKENGRGNHRSSHQAHGRRPDERLQAFCSITFDDSFVVRDLKIIEGTKGPFVAMPSRKLTDRCPQCGCKNHLRAALLQPVRRQARTRTAPIRDDDGRAKLHADIAHPINSACREMIQQRVRESAGFNRGCERAKLPGYISRYDDFDQEDAPFIRGDFPAAATPLADGQTRGAAGRTAGAWAASHPVRESTGAGDSRAFNRV